MMKVLKKVLCVLAVAVSCVMMAAPTCFALTCPSDTPGAGKTVNSISECTVVSSDKDISTTAKNIYGMIIGLVGVATVIVMIIGAISFMTSQGDAPKVAKARNTILYGAIGLVVVILAYAIVSFVISSTEGGSPAAPAVVDPAGGDDEG